MQQSAWSIQSLLQLVGVLVFCAGAPAQIADVVRPDQRGDFRSVRILGPRGAYPQRLWLVVDRDPRGLWCRDAVGTPLVAVRYGAVLETDLRDGPLPPLLNHRGTPYLRVRVKPLDILVEARLLDRGQALRCAVRANAQYLAPIHPDSLAGLGVTP